MRGDGSEKSRERGSKTDVLCRRKFCDHLSFLLNFSEELWISSQSGIDSTCRAVKIIRTQDGPRRNRTRHFLAVYGTILEKCLKCLLIYACRTIFLSSSLCAIRLGGLPFPDHHGPKTGWSDCSWRHFWKLCEPRSDFATPENRVMDPVLKKMNQF